MSAVLTVTVLGSVIGLGGPAQADDAVPTSPPTVAAGSAPEATEPAPGATTPAPVDQAAPTATESAPATTSAPTAKKAAPDQTPAVEQAAAPDVALLSTVVNPAADAVKVAWVDDDPGSTEPATLPYTLQQALSAAAATGSIVHVVDGELGYTAALTVPRSVTVRSATGTRINALWSFSANGVTFTQDPTITLSGTAANGRSIITVPAARTGVTLNDVNIVARDAYTGTTGLLINSSTGTTIDNFRFDGGAGAVGNYGISARAANGVVVNGATITNVSVGYFVHSSETLTTAPVFTDVAITAKTFGIQTGGGTGARFTNVTVTGTGNVANTAAVDLASSTGATFQNITFTGFPYGIKSVATSGVGVQVDGGQIDASLIGIALGTTDGATIENLTVDGPGGTLNTMFGIDGYGTDVTLDNVDITGFPTGYRTRAASGTGLTANDVTVAGTVYTGLILGTTDGSRLSGVTVTGTGTGYTATSTGVQLGASQNVTVSDLTVRDLAIGIGSGGVGNAGPNKLNVSITDATFERVTAGISLNNYGSITIDRVEVVTDAPRGSGVYLRETKHTSISNLTVQGTAGPTYQSGTNGIRTYYSEDITVTDVTIDGGSTGFYWDMTKAVAVTGAEISNQVWYGTYSENILNWTMTGSSFHDNAAIANLTINPTPPEYDPRNERTTSSAVHFWDNTFTNHGAGIYLPLGFGGMEFDHNTVSGTPTRFVVYAAPAHNIDVHDNTIDFTPADADSAAILIGTDVYTNLDTDDYTSSNITVTDNVFSGPGTFVRTGSAGGVQTALDDDTTVMVRGNTFPADSVAVDARPNSGGKDGVAVDARDHGNPNDFGSVCRATVPQTGYDGGGATLLEDSTGQVLYPEQCIDLALVESTPTKAGSGSISLLDDDDLMVGDLESWTLTPHNDGITTAASGWTVTQVLPDGIELAGMTGAGYSYDGLVATADDDLAAGADGPVITVTVRIASVDWADGEPSRTFQNVAYVTPLPEADAFDMDGDGFVDHRFEAFNPLVVPVIGTDTYATETNNDTEGVFTVVADALPLPPDDDPDDGGTDGGTDDGTDNPDNPTTPSGLTDSPRSLLSASERTAGTFRLAENRTGMAQTGVEVGPLAVLAAALLGTGAAAVVVTRRRTSR